MLQRIPEKYFEVAGTGFGLFASLSIAFQIFAEYSSPNASTLSIGYVVGFLLIFGFWILYGLRFRRAALWVTNGIALIMQTLLLLVIPAK